MRSSNFTFSLTSPSRTPPSSFKARTKEQKVQVLVKLRQRDTVFTSMYTKDTPWGKILAKERERAREPSQHGTKTGTIYRYINCKVSEKMRALATRINCSKSKDELDTRSLSKFFVEVASMYNEENQKELNYCILLARWSSVYRLW